MRKNCACIKFIFYSYSTYISLYVCCLFCKVIYYNRMSNKRGGKSTNIYTVCERERMTHNTVVDLSDINPHILFTI